MEQEQVFVDSLDGYEFEELCAQIYRRLGYEVQNVPDVGDEGRDLVLRSPQGETIIVECKHWPSGAIGRPVVQKLHSAILTYQGASKGIILTTGSFAGPARDYITKLNEPIELMDFHRLKDLAAKAGFVLVSTRDPVPVLSFSLSDRDALKRLLDAKVFCSFLSAPSVPSELFSVASRSITLKPAYLVRYSLRQDFSTSVGVLHQLNVDDARLLLEARNGDMLPQGLTMFLQQASVVPLKEALGQGGKIPQESFKLGGAELKEAAKTHIVSLHRAVISYTARNNRSYTLDCIPSKRNIFLKDIRQVYVPEQALDVRALSHQYKMNFVEDGQHIYWLEHPLIYRCCLCAATLEQGLLCNACGAIAHSPRIIFPHSFRCKVCKKTICKRCAFVVRRWGFFKKILCYQCTGAYPKTKVRKLVAESPTSPSAASVLPRH